MTNGIGQVNRLIPGLQPGIEAKGNLEAKASDGKFTEIFGELINSVKEFRTQRNNKTKNVSELKEERKKLNKDIKEKIIVIKEINKNKVNILKKHSIKKNPHKIKKKNKSIK